MYMFVFKNGQGIIIGVQNCEGVCHKTLGRPANSNKTLNLRKYHTERGTERDGKLHDFIYP